MTTDRQFQQLLDRTAKAAEAHFAAGQALGKIFEERYGIHYGEVDADAIIDVCDHIGGHITVEECDDAMAQCGHPPLPH
jgi:hypothetical protein